MKLTKLTSCRIFLASSSVLLCAASSASAIIIAQEDFSGPSFPFTLEGGEAATIQNNAGVGTYISNVANNPDAGVGYSWDGQSLGLGQSWVFSVEASLSTGFLTQMQSESFDDFAAVGIMVGKAFASGGFSNLMFLSLATNRDAVGVSSFLNLETISGGSASDASFGVGVESADLIFSYDSTTMMLEAKSLDGTTTLGSVDVVNDWGMSGSDTFVFGIHGNSGEIAVANAGDMSLDNMSLETVPEPSSTALLGLGGLVLLLRRRR